jgi:hypothetical protein
MMTITVIGWITDLQVNKTNPPKSPQETMASGQMIDGKPRGS